MALQTKSGNVPVAGMHDLLPMDAERLDQIHKILHLLHDISAASNNVANMSLFTELVHGLILLQRWVDVFIYLMDSQTQSVE